MKSERKLDKGECYRCKKSIDWEKIEPTYFDPVGYKSYVHKCECGHEQSKHIPFSKEKKSLWMELRKMLVGE